MLTNLFNSFEAELPSELQYTDWQYCTCPSHILVQDHRLCFTLVMGYCFSAPNRRCDERLVDFSIKYFSLSLIEGSVGIPSSLSDSNINIAQHPYHAFGRLHCSLQLCKQQKVSVVYPILDTCPLPMWMSAFSTKQAAALYLYLCSCAEVTRRAMLLHIRQWGSGSVKFSQ